MTYTWNDLVRAYYPEADNDFAHDILWERTAYPCTKDVRYIAKQIRSAVRAYKNNIKVCDMCGKKYPYHSNRCPNTY